MNNFAERLAYAFAQTDLTQAELARRTGIGRNSISDYLKGKYDAKQDNIYLLANALGVNEAWLMGMDAPMKKESIQNIFDQLHPKYKAKVLNYAKHQLKIQEYNTEEDMPYTLAAHSDDPNKKVSEDDLDNINSVLDEIDRKYDEK